MFWTAVLGGFQQFFSHWQVLVAAVVCILINFGSLHLWGMWYKNSPEGCLGHLLNLMGQWFLQSIETAFLVGFLFFS